MKNFSQHVTDVSASTLLSQLVLCRDSSREKILAFQQARLRSLVAHAYEHVPFYRRLFDRHRLRPEDIRSLDDLQRIPITTKHELQEAGLPQRLARGVNPSRLVAHTTSGSSGEMLTIHRAWLEERVLNFLRQRAVKAYGVRRGDRRVQIKLIDHNDSHAENPTQKTVPAIDLSRRIILDCRQEPASLLAALRRLRPEVLSGYPATLARIAQEMSEQDRQLVTPRLLITGGETLTPLMREQITAAFQVPVYDVYGSFEFNLIAWQCPLGDSYHVCDEGLILEVLKDGRPARPGERGEVVGTALHSFAMPFIRYRLEDIVTRGGPNCACGRAFSTLGAIEGRKLDYFLLPDGRLLHPYELFESTVHLTTTWVREYQYVQERIDLVVLRVAPLTPPTPHQLQAMRQILQERLGRGVELQLSLMDAIPREPSGKFRVYRSFLDSRHSSRAHTPGS